MDITTLAIRYDTLCKELHQRMSASKKWTGLPALLDEIHAVRCLYRSHVKGFMVAGDLGDAAPPHWVDRPQFRYHGSLVL